MILGRRGALTGLAGLLFAPYVARAESLMPISATDTYPLGGFLSWEQITAEMARLTRLALTRRDTVAGWGTLSAGIEHRQFGVEMGFERNAFGQSLQAVRERMLEPAAIELAMAIPAGHRVLIEPCPLPMGVDAVAAISKGGCGLRGVRHYDINYDLMRARFDIRSVRA